MTSLARPVRLGAAFGLTLLVYWANVVTPPEMRLAILYLLPALLVTWYDGLAWGIAFGVLGVVLREIVALDQMPPDTRALDRVVNLASYLLVLGAGMTALLALRRKEAELRELATTDPLTRVLNARAFSERLSRELERSRRYNRPISLLYLDLDNFKDVNDAHGHQTGDAVLRLVADAMHGAVRQTDVVGRLGGDEFAVLMPETDAALADAAAGRLASSLRTVFRGTPNVTASVGVVSCAGTDASADRVLGRADQAMYEAKRAGKDRVVKVAL